MNDRLRRSSSVLLPIGLSLVVGVVLLLVVGAPPFEALKLLWEGSFGTWLKVGDTLMAWVPITLAAAGLIITFQAGLWNIGVEGQVVGGAILTTLIVREMPGPSLVIIPIAIVAGMVGGALWALLPGLLKTLLRVNEIFSGVALNFVAAGITTYLIIGPWSREGIASTSGTDVFRREAWLPTVGTTRLSLVAVGVTLAAVLAVYLLMRGTRYGLRLKAVGRNPRSAFLLGIPTNRYMLSSFLLCGALAGVAGTMQAIGFHHKLVPSVSGGYGFLGILVVLLTGFRAAWIAPVGLFFAAISVGSTQLSLRLNLDSALAGVLQGLLVLFIMLVGGWQRLRARRAGAADEAVTGPPAPVPTPTAGV